MTVAAVLRLSKTSGMGITDGQITNTSYDGNVVRSYNFGQKITRVNQTPVFILNSQSLSYGGKILDVLQDTLKDDRTYSGILAKLREAYQAVRDETFKTGVLDRFHLTWEDFIQGRAGEDIRKEVERRAKYPEQFNPHFLVGGFNIPKERFDFDAVFYPGQIVCGGSKAYDTTGIGEESADRVIGETLHYMSPYERTNIERYLGARILMEAVRSAGHNTGVGGTPQMMWTCGPDFFELGHEESNMLDAALYCERKGMLDKPYVNTLFQRSIQDGAKTTELLPELMEMIPHTELANIFWTQSLHV